MINAIVILLDRPLWFAMQKKQIYDLQFIIDNYKCHSCKLFSKKKSLQNSAHENED